MRTALRAMVAGLLLASPTLWAGAQLSFVRTALKGGNPVTALTCAHDDARAGECRVARARGSVVEKSVSLPLERAQALLAEAAAKLKPFAEAREPAAPGRTCRLQWTVSESRQEYRGCVPAQGNVDHRLVRTLMALEHRLDAELAR